SVSRIQERLAKGCPVATNLDLKLYNMPMVGRYAKKTRVIRVPDKPSLNDLLAIGVGNTSYDESRNGLLVLDECGTWFNSRSWGDKDRQPVIDWFLHARKLGWDIIFLIQDVSIMDKQARLALAEHVVYCRRSDKLNIPFIGSIMNLLSGTRFSLPKIHFGIVKYGDNVNSITVDKWIYTGKSLYSAYNTKQAFTDNYPHGAYSYIPPFITHGQFSVNRGFKYYMRLTKIYFRKSNRFILMLSFLALGLGLGFWLQSGKNVDEISAIKSAYAEQARVVTPVATSDLPRLSISSFSQLGFDVSVTFVDAKGMKYQYFDLIKDGYSVDIKDACRIVIKKGRYLQAVTCQE
ncbi:hypothetical protein CH136_23155, partial [Salmonella enterica]|nr:hypothetical protein [Salmonella enterica]